MKDKSIVLTIPFEKRDQLCNALIQVLLHINTSGMPGDQMQIKFRDVNRKDIMEHVQTLIINLY